MGRRVLAILAATVIALVGAVLVLLYARGADERAIADASPTTVFVSAETIPAGTSIRDAVRQEQLTETQAAAQSVPTGALTTVDDTNSSLVALTDIPPGQYVLESSFGDTPVGEKALQVAAGKLAVSVELSDPARVGQFVTPGSYLTIFMTYKLKDLSPTEEAQVFNEQDIKGTSVLLENAKVIAMGETSLTPAQTSQGDDQQNDQQNSEVQSFLVTLEVSPEQAARLVHGINNYELYAGLRGSDVKIDNDLGVTDLTMLGDSVR
jgi:pilus assembly protein CpaB